MHWIKSFALNDFFYRNRIALWLFIISCLPLTFYWLGILNIERNLIQDVDARHLYPVARGQVNTSHNMSNGHIQSICRVDVEQRDNVCGITFLIGESIDKGLDLSRYNSVRILIRSEHNEAYNSVRLQFKNYHPNYSTPTNTSSLKYHGVTLDTDDTFTDYTIPINELDVESWWLFFNKIRMADSSQDLSNVSYIELIHNGLGGKGTYTIEIARLEMIGTVLSLDTLLNTTLAMWCLLLVYMVLQHDQTLKMQLYKDPLTGSKNRRGLKDYLSKLNLSKANPQDLSLINIDLDGFKGINERFGHDVGDAVLIKVCKRIQTIVKQAHISKAHYCLIRISGAEFAILLRQINEDKVVSLAQTIVTRLAHPMDINGNAIVATFSIGVASEKGNDINTTQLFKNAYNAMYFAKFSGKNQWKLFDEALQQIFASTQHSFLQLKTRVEALDSLWSFKTLYDIQNDRLASVQLSLNPEAIKIFRTGLLPVKDKAKENLIANDILHYVIDQLLVFVNNKKAWFDTHQIQLIVDLHVGGHIRMILSPESLEKSIQELAEVLPISFVIRQDNWEIYTQIVPKNFERSEDNRLSLCVRDLINLKGGLSTLDSFNVKEVMFVEDYIQKHYQDGHFNQRFRSMNTYLHTLGILVICADDVEDSKQIAALQEANVDLLLDYLSDESTRFADVEALIGMNDELIASSLHKLIDR